MGGSPRNGGSTRRVLGSRDPRRTDGTVGDRVEGQEGPRGAARGRRGAGRARRAVRRGPERGLARPRGGGSRPRGGGEHRDPRGGDGRREDRRPGGRPGHLQARHIEAPWRGGSSSPGSVPSPPWAPGSTSSGRASPPAGTASVASRTSIHQKIGRAH